MDDPTLAEEVRRLADEVRRLLAAQTTSYPLTYDTAGLYSTATVRAGIWRGRLAAPPAMVVVGTEPARSEP